MPDLTAAYTALQKADAAGDSAGAKQLADYIRSQTAPPQPAVDQTTGMSGPEKFLTGYGQASEGLLRGAEQLGLTGLAKITGNPTYSRKAAQIAQEVTNSRSLDAPLLKSGAGLAGSIAGNIVPTIAAPEGKIATLATGALQGALQPTGTGEGGFDRTINAGEGMGGAALGGAGNWLLQHIAQPIKSGLTPIASAAVQKLQSSGVPLDLAQKTGSEMLQRIKSTLADLPVTSGWAKENAAAQKSAFTAAALRSIGSDSETASPEALQAAKTRIGSVFDEHAQRGLDLDTNVASSLQKAQQSLQRLVPESNQGPIKTQINDLLSSAAQNDGHINGSVLQRVNSDLGSLARSPDVGPIAGQLRSDLAGHMQEQGTPEQAAAIARARVEYNNLKSIEPAVNADESVSAKRLYQALRSPRFGNRNRLLYGSGDQELPDLAKSGSQILPETLPNSGTAGHLAGIMTMGAPAVMAAPFIHPALNAMNSEPAEPGTHPWLNAAKTSGEIGLGLGAALLAKKGFSSPMVSNYLASGIGGPASGATSNAVRGFLTLPERNKAIAQLLKFGPGAAMLASPQAAQQ